MRIFKNTLTSKNLELLIATTQDLIMESYLVKSKHIFKDQYEFTGVLYMALNALFLFILPHRPP